jgi:hypothetical protein
MLGVLHLKAQDADDIYWMQKKKPVAPLEPLPKRINPKPAMTILLPIPLPIPIPTITLITPSQALVPNLDPTWGTAKTPINPKSIMP